MSFYWFDILAAVILLAYAAFSWLRGFVREFFAALAWVGGYFGAAYFSPALSNVLKGHIKYAMLADVLAFILAYIGIFAAVRLVGWLVYEKAGLKNLPNLVDGPLGALMGLAKGALFIAAILLPLNYFPLYKQEFYGKSYIARWAYAISATAAPVLGMDMGQAPTAIQEGLDTIKSAMPEPPALLKPGQKREAERLQTAAGKMLSPQAPPVKKLVPVVKQTPDTNTEGERDRMDKFMRTLP